MNGLIVQPNAQWLMYGAQFDGGLFGISSTPPYAAFDDEMFVSAVSNPDNVFVWANAFDGDWPQLGNQDGLTIRTDFAQGISWADPRYVYFQTADSDGHLWRTDHWMRSQSTTVCEDIGREYGVGSHLPRELLVFPEHDCAVSSVEQQSTSPGDSGHHYFAKIDLSSGQITDTLASLRYDFPITTTSVRRQLLAWCSDRVNGDIYSLELEVRYRENPSTGNPQVNTITRFLMRTNVGGGRATLGQWRLTPSSSPQVIPYAPTWDYETGRLLVCFRRWPSVQQDTFTSPTSTATDTIEALDSDGFSVETLVSYTPDTVENFPGAGEWFHRRIPALAWVNGLEHRLYQWRATHPGRSLSDDRLYGYAPDGTDEQAIVETGWYTDMFGRAAQSSSSTLPYKYAFGPGMRAQWEL